MTVDRNGLEVLEREECLALLARGSLGRLALSVGALPTIVPVNYRLVDDVVVLRTGVGTTIDSATRAAVVAFEVDAIDPVDHTGWSVVVTGMATDVPPHPLTRPVDLGAVPRWAPEGESRLVYLATDRATGRRITHRRPGFGTLVPSDRDRVP